MIENRFILLRQPNGEDPHLFPSGAQPLALAEAQRAAEREIHNQLAVGGEPDRLLLFDLTGISHRPLSITANNLELLEDETSIANAFASLDR